MRLKKFIEHMPVPHVKQPENKNERDPSYSIEIKEVAHQFHPDLPETRVWAFDGQIPGPTFDVQKGEKIQVEWKNQLPKDHFLPVDPTLHGSGELPGGRTAVHIHGAKVEEDFDGYPESWYTKDYEQTGPTFKHKVYHYPNAQRAMTLWYHDHTMGITRLNMYAGLSGFYLLHDEEEQNLELPKGKYDIPILLQDRSFNEDGSLDYPTGEQVSEELEVSHVEEAYGDTVVVNGKVWPYMDVEPRAYRLRFLNGANSRYFHLDLSPFKAYLIGTDGGLIEKPQKLEGFVLGPAERVEVLIDFSQLAGQTITLTNSAPAPYPDGDLDEAMKDVLQFRIQDRASESESFDISQLSGLSTIQPLHEKEAVRTRDLLLNHTEDEYGRPVHLLDGNAWHDPITEDPKLGTVEIWRFINVTDDAHPMHIHLVDFQVLDHQAFDLDHYEQTGEIKYMGDKKRPTMTEQGLKDTVTVKPGEAVRVIARFEPYAGTYVYHCHMIEHEDYDMMRPYKVVE